MVKIIGGLDMKKTLLVCTLIFSLVFCLCACGNKTAIDTNTFKTICEGEDLIVQDVSSQYSDYEYISVGTVASSGPWQIEFYELSNEEFAHQMFESNKLDFERFEGSASSEKSVSVKNHEMYSLTSGGKFMYISRIDNTMVFVNTDKEYKEDINKILDKLGY